MRTLFCSGDKGSSSNWHKEREILVHIISEFRVERASGAAGSRGPGMSAGLAAFYFSALLS